MAPGTYRVTVTAVECRRRALASLAPPLRGVRLAPRDNGRCGHREAGRCHGANPEALKGRRPRADERIRTADPFITSEQDHVRKDLHDYVLRRRVRPVGCTSGCTPATRTALEGGLPTLTSPRSSRLREPSL